MVKKLLLNCTTTLLGIMITQYEEGNITPDELRINTVLKKSFLEENILEVEKPEDRVSAQKLIQKLDNIYLRSVDNAMLNKENTTNQSLI